MTETAQNVPQTTDDQYVAGDTAILTASISLTDSTDTDLSGSDIEFALTRYSGGDPLVEKSVGNGISLTDTDGEVEVTIDPEDTEDLGAIGGEEYHYEIEVTDSAGDVATVTTGTWTIHPDTA